MARAHCIDRVDVEALAARQPAQQLPPQIQLCNPRQDGGQTTLRLYTRRVAVGAEQAAVLERCERTAIAVLANAVKNDVEPARQDTVLVEILGRCHQSGALLRARPSLSAETRYAIYAAHFCI